MLQQIYIHVREKFERHVRETSTNTMKLSRYLWKINIDLLSLQHLNILIMSQFCIYVELRPFVSQFLRHSLGDPIEFPPQSVENSTIHHFIDRLPAGRVPDTAGVELTAIAIPDSKTKPAATYNYMSPRGKEAVSQCCELLFNRCMWVELGDMSALGCKTMTAIYAWCEKHGVSIDYADTIRQRYYRMRESYTKRGIDLRKTSRNRKGD